jgi:transposase
MLYYGLDVHKRYTRFCVMEDSGEILTEGNCPTNELALHPAFSLKGEKKVVLEGGANWHHVFDTLEPLVDELKLAHPLRVRAIAAARVKTDAIDARTLAHLLRSDLIPPAYVPPRRVREQRELFRFRLDLIGQRTATKNRIHAMIAKDGWSSPTTDLFGRKGRAWLAELPLDEAKRERLESLLGLVDHLTVEIKHAEMRIREKVSWDEQARLLLTIPGVGPLTAFVILAEIGDVHRFADANHLVSYAGLAPRVRSSGGKTRLGNITKQGPSALRWALIEATHVAVRRPGRLQELHRRLRKAKGAALAAVACARQLLVVIYHMLTRGDAFRAFGSSNYLLTPEVA